MGGVGAKINLSGDMRDDLELFSESNGRWIVQVKPEFEEIFSNRFDFARKIGHVNNDISFNLSKGEKVRFSIDELRKIWTEPLWNRLA